VVKVEKKLHGEKAHQETEAVFDGARKLDGCWCIFQLRDVIIECKNWTGKVERTIQDISYIVAQIVVPRISWDSDTVALRKI
jgi:hypothetical protein